MTKTLPRSITTTKRTSEYHQKGDYHLNLDPNWPYLPVYLEKMSYVNKFLDSLDQDQTIIDLGCGEGTLVKSFRQKGMDIVGLDLNYQSKYVKKGNILRLPFPNRSFDVVMCLDVLEHLDISDQVKAIKEINRVLKPDGKLLLSVPNLAHLASRFSFLLLGKLLRTSKIERHPGDRPLKEYKTLIQPYFKTVKIKGFFPTFPLISVFTLLIPSKIIFWHKIYNYFLAYPDWCFLNVITAQKT